MLATRRHINRRQSARIICEALEPRTLLSQTWNVTDTGNITTNGTNLKNILNGTTLQGGLPLQLGDTIVLSANVTYFSHTGFTLYNVTGGSGTITIESSALASLPAGTRVSNLSSVTQYMPKITADNFGDGVLITQKYTGSGFLPAHNFSLLGIEIAPSNGTQGFGAGLLDLGTGGSFQTSTSQVPSNFIIDRCYIHGYDDLTNAYLATGYKTGVSLNCLNATVENSYISDIHNTGNDSQAVSGFNGLGNYTITNNFLEATGENLFFGGADSTLPVGVDISNVTATHNFLYKRLVWDQYDPSYLGVHQDVKNIFELKHATNVLFDSNLLENCWVGADQVGEGICLGPKNQGGGNTWALIHDVTVTNNIILNVNEGVQLGANTVSDNGYTTLPMYNVLVRNNLIQAANAGPGNGVGYGFAIGGGGQGQPPGANLTIDHNTVFDSSAGVNLGSSQPFPLAWTGFTFTNNLVQFGGEAITSTPGYGSKALNTFMSGVTITNGGTGYTSAPTVTFSGGLGAGGVAATGTALLNSTTHTVYNVQITNNGSGYTSTPTIIFGAVAGASGAAATATADLNASDNNYGKVIGWNVEGNVFFGSGTSGSTSGYPAGNYFPTTEDVTGMQDPAGQLAGLLSTSPYYADGVNVTTGKSNSSIPGVNMSGLSGITDFTAVDAALTGYWKFDEGSGTTTADASGSGKTATLSSSSLWTTSGQSNNAITLTGGSSGSVSISTFSTTSNFSFAAWVNPTNFSATQYIASTANAAFSLSINTAGKLVATGKTGSVTASTAMTAGNWYLVGVTYNGTTLTVYLNGASVGSVAATTATGSTTLYLGGNGGSVSALNGSLDEARYYNTDMSATNINGLTGMAQLYSNFGPQIGVIGPNGGSHITTTTSTFSTHAVDHAVGDGSTNSSPAPLSFTWSEYSGPAGGVTFAATNGSNAGQTCNATWSASGNYVIAITVTDGHGGSSTSLHPLVVTGIGGSTPTAPTNIAATPGLTNVVVTWTDNASNETGFDVQRSSDGGISWVDLGNVASSTGTGSVVTYTDTSVANDGTAYLYQVAAYNGSGDSNYDASTCAVACPIAYDGFNYTVGNGTNWNGLNTGIGFASNWTLSNTSNANVVSGSLAYSSAGHALTTSANQVTMGSTTATTTLSTTVGPTGAVTDLWLSNVFSLTVSSSYEMVWIGPSGNEVHIGAGSTGSNTLNGKVIVGSNNYPLVTGVTPVANTTYFIVAEIKYLTSGDIVNMWINPTPGVAPGTPTGTVTLPATSQLANTTAVELSRINGATGTATFDELRLGVSYAAVAPDPLVSPTPTYTPVPSTNSPVTIPNSPLNAHALFQSFLTATPALTADIDLAPAVITPSYHLEQPDDPRTLDQPTDLLLADIIT